MTKQEILGMWQEIDAFANEFGYDEDNASTRKLLKACKEYIEAH